MKVNYTDISRIVGYNYEKSEKAFYLTDPIFIIVVYANKKIWLKIPRNFRSDGCTIPKSFRWLMGCPHTGKYLPASIIHDYILEYPETVNYNRRFASRIFKTALLNEGVSPLKAEIMYLAVDLWQWLKNFRIRKWK